MRRHVHSQIMGQQSTEELANRSDSVIHGKLSADTSDSFSLDFGHEPSDEIGTRINAQGVQRRRPQ